jgi:hypothetical protein
MMDDVFAVCLGALILFGSAFLMFFLGMVGYILVRETFFHEPQEEPKPQVIYIFPETLNDGCY